MSEYDCARCGKSITGHVERWEPTLDRRQYLMDERDLDWFPTRPVAPLCLDCHTHLESLKDAHHVAGSDGDTDRAREVMERIEGFLDDIDMDAFRDETEF